MKRATKIGLPVLIIVLGFVTMQVLLALRTETPKKPPQVTEKLVEAVEVELGPIATRISGLGRLETSDPIQLFAEATGTLERGSVDFKPGQAFAAGDVLLKIDDRQATYVLNSTKSQLLTALARVLPEIKVDFPDQYRVWQDYFDGCTFDKPLDPLPEVSNTRIRLFLARFNVYDLYYSIRNQEVALEKHRVRAPFDGSILSTSLRVGSTARSGSLLGEIINLGDMEVAVPLAIGDITWIDQATPVTFRSGELNRRWNGRITRISSNIDQRTQTVDVHIELDRDQERAPISGLYLEADIPGRTIDNAFAVPPRAIYENRYVYVIDDGVLDRRDVNIIRREPDRVIVDSGLETGDILVTEVMQGVAPGMPAAPKSFGTERAER